MLDFSPVGTAACSQGIHPLELNAQNPRKPQRGDIEKVKCVWCLISNLLKEPL